MVPYSLPDSSVLNALKRENTFFRTSYDKSGVSFESPKGSRRVILTSSLLARIVSDCVIAIKNENGHEVYGTRSYQKFSSYLKYCMPCVVGDGRYFLTLDVKSKNDNKYYTYFTERNIPIVVNAGNIFFPVSSTEMQNSFFLSTMNTKGNMQLALSASDLIQKDNINVKNLAEYIAKDVYENIEIVKRVHAWVAQNIYYDKDSLPNKVHERKDNSALGTRIGQKGVCRGYTNLTVALLRSLNIPALVVSTFTLGGIQGGGWEVPENMMKEGNHVIPFAKVGRRWIMMDPTWESPNNYEHKYYVGGNSLSYPYRYFDTSIEFISQTHRFVTVLNI